MPYVLQIFSETFLVDHNTPTPEVYKTSNLVKQIFSQDITHVLKIFYLGSQ